jgi:CHAD domain-containing protein
MTAAERHYRLASLKAGRLTLEALAERFVVHGDQPSKVRRSYLDTFDWKLYRAGVVLVAHTESRCTTLIVSGDSNPADLRSPVESIPAFGADLPSGRLRDSIAPQSGIRRLLPVVQVSASRERFRVLDKRQKTVARIELEKRTASTSTGQRRNLPALLRVVSLKGYRREFEAVNRGLRRLGDVEAVESDEQTEALGAFGRQPGDYSSKFQLDLVGEAAGAGEVRRILGALLDTLEANLDGLRRDLDIEFLHDFRVSVRRTRTVLSQIKGVIPKEVLDRFKPEFSWLGRITGPTRDLDVYLLKMKDYRASLPSSVSGDLEPLQQFLEAHRSQALARLLVDLESKRFNDLVRNWRQFVKQSVRADEGTGGSELSTLELARKEIKKAYKRLLKKGRAIGAETPPEALHRLRIDGKKLRYLLEFFRSLYDKREIEDLIGALKRLQDNLGDFNDFGVQQGMLSVFGQQMVDEKIHSAAALMAMGRLVDKLEHGEAAERARFAERFAEFDSRKNRRRYEKLFEISAI